MLGESLLNGEKLKMLEVFAVIPKESPKFSGDGTYATQFLHPLRTASHLDMLLYQKPPT